MLLTKCTNDSLSAVYFLADGEATTDGQGFVTVCLKKNSSSHGWALIRDDNYMIDQLKLGVHAACQQNGYLGSPDWTSKPMYVYHCRQ